MQVHSLCSWEARRSTYPLHVCHPGVACDLTCQPSAVSTQPVAEKTILLTYFYKHCMHRLTAPLMANTTEERISKGTSDRDIIVLWAQPSCSHVGNAVADARYWAFDTH